MQIRTAPAPQDCDKHANIAYDAKDLKACLTVDDSASTYTAPDGTAYTTWEECAMVRIIRTDRSRCLAEGGKGQVPSLGSCQERLAASWQSLTRAPRRPRTAHRAPTRRTQ